MNQRQLEVPREPWPPSKGQQALNPQWNQCSILDTEATWGRDGDGDSGTIRRYTEESSRELDD